MNGLLDGFLYFTLESSFNLYLFQSCVVWQDIKSSGLMDRIYSSADKCRLLARKRHGNPYVSPRHSNSSFEVNQLRRPRIALDCYKWGIADSRFSTPLGLGAPTVQVYMDVYRWCKGWERVEQLEVQMDVSAGSALVDDAPHWYSRAVGAAAFGEAPPLTPMWWWWGGGYHFCSPPLTCYQEAFRESERGDYLVQTGCTDQPRYFYLSLISEGLYSFLMEFFFFFLSRNERKKIDKDWFQKRRRSCWGSAHLSHRKCSKSFITQSASWTAWRRNGGNERGTEEWDSCLYFCLLGLSSSVFESHFLFLNSCTFLHSFLFFSLEFQGEFSPFFCSLDLNLMHLFIFSFPSLIPAPRREQSQL